jgi:antagonist of KipI
VGADFAATLDGVPVPLWTPFQAAAGQSLRLGGARAGARSYLCVRGGIEAPEILGSRSTHLPSRIGGFAGRALRKGDLLPIGDPPPALPPLEIRPGVLAQLRPASAVLRITAAAHSASFPDSSRAALLAESWGVQTDSSRMGLRLSGAALAAPLGGSMTTAGAPLGAIQVPPSGEPVILFVDHQTTGGYPIIGCVISADHWRIGQLRPRQTVRFELVSFDDARRLLLAQEELLRAEILGL